MNLQQKKETRKTVTEHITRVVLSIKDGNGADIDPEYVANVVESRIDVNQVAPHLSRYLAIQQLRQETRGILRKMFDPIEKVNELMKSGTDDLFGDLLQDHYPAKREILGETRRIYVIRENLSEEEMEENALRMEKAGNSLLKHAEALRAWFYG